MPAPLALIQQTRRMLSVVTFLVQSSYALNKSHVVRSVDGMPRIRGASQWGTLEMRMNFVAAGLLACGFSFVAAPAVAAPQDFDLTNDTGYEISSVWIGEHGQPEWGDDIMGQGTLADGATVHIHFPGGRGETCDWDMQVSWTGYNEHPQWTDGFDLCTISHITLKWDKDTKVTSAVYE